MMKDFDATRRRVLRVAPTVGLLALVSLFLLEGQKSWLWPWLYAASTNVLGVLFGLAVVSLIWEFFVRRDHGNDLRHYLRLGSSVAKSGLQDVTPRSKLDWQDLLASANEVTVLTFNAEWLDRNAYILRDVAKTRPLVVTVAVPVKGGSYLERHAALTDSSAEALGTQISEMVSKAVRLWRDARTGPQALHKNSKLSVFEHDISLGYEVVAIDQTTIVTLAAPGDAGESLDRVAFVYGQNLEEYPTSFFLSFRSQIADMNRLDEA